MTLMALVMMAVMALVWAVMAIMSFVMGLIMVGVLIMPLAMIMFVRVAALASPVLLVYLMIWPMAAL
jgi:hypothetical protein